MSSSNIAILSLFPQIIEQTLALGITKRGSVRCIDLRAYAPKGRADASSYAPGPGMLLRADVLAEAVRAHRAENPEAWVVHLSPRGALLDVAAVKRLAAKPSLLLIASRYEGSDQRFLDAYADEEISIGSYVLSGGELAAAVLADALLRQNEDVLQSEAAAEESFETGLLEYPHYAPPRVFEGVPVPEVLTGGNHAAIAEWRWRQALGQTWLTRPDLLLNYPLCEAEPVQGLNQLRKQNKLLQRRIGALENAIQEIKDVRQRKGSHGNL